MTASRRRPLGTHERPNAGFTNDWITPPHVLADLGPFDLDPCASETQPWRTAARHYTERDDGMAQAWRGFVWLNPPYGAEAWRWLRRLADHPDGGIALVFARTETRGFVDTVWRRASSLRFLHGRLRFHRPDGAAAGTSGAPSVLVGYGPEADERLRRSGLTGTFVTLTEATD